MSYALMQKIQCLLCQGEFDGTCYLVPSHRDGNGYHCETCGRYDISGSALADSFVDSELGGTTRAVLSHRIRLAQKKDFIPLITISVIDSAKNDRLPTPPTQAINLLRAIGDKIQATAKPFGPDEQIGATIGVANSSAQYRLFEALIEKGLLKKTGQRQRQRVSGGTVSEPTFDLTLDGWERYELESRGLVAGSTGFIAMKFGDPILDGLVSETIKPKIHRSLNYRLVDMRDVARAGVIDNIMRAQIRDAAFVIVDLTHDNSGAYWEAGYAEGLGKPVIYICEKNKFDSAKTHFDTNHCTTVIWDANNIGEFAEQLIATLRRSLRLFEDAHSVAAVRIGS